MPGRDSGRGTHRAELDVNHPAELREAGDLGAGAGQQPARAAPPRTDVAWDEAAETLGLLAGKWILSVLRVLDRSGTRRHNQLRREIGANVSARSLDATLRRMEADGLVERRVDPGTPPAVSYRLTPLARSLLAPLGELGRWGVAHPRKPAARGRRPRGSEPAA